ncbi:hypothetical protein GN956_G14310 [Arapaima gigas]
MATGRKDWEGGLKGRVLLPDRCGPPDDLRWAALSLPLPVPPAPCEEPSDQRYELSLWCHPEGEARSRTFRPLCPCS